MVSFTDIRAAAETVRRFFPETPLLFARRLSHRLGIELYLKLDCLTPVRTFKLRGALVKMEELHRSGATGPVVTASAGNHGLAVAKAARLYGRPALVVVPASANPQKVQAIEAQGAQVVHHGIDYQAAYEHSLAISTQEGWSHLHAFDDPAVIAGQGTLGLELPETDTFLCGIGGGGLISGVATVLKTRFPDVRIIGVQPEGADSMARSLEAGRVVGVAEVRTIADGLSARQPGALTFDLTRRYTDQVVRVSDDDLLTALRLLLREEQIVAEPAGVAGLAALLRWPELAKGRVTVPITGANVSDEVLAQVMAP